MSLSTPLDKADANRDLASSMEDDGEKTPVSVGWRGLGVGDLFDWEIAVMLWFLFPKQNYEGSSCCLSRKEVNFKYYHMVRVSWFGWLGLTLSQANSTSTFLKMECQVRP